MSAPSGPCTNVVRLTAEPTLSQAGVYETTYVPRDTGGYQAEAIVTDSTGMEVGRAEFRVDFRPCGPPDEFRSLKTQPGVARNIASERGLKSSRQVR